MDPIYQREVLAFGEKIGLAELEEAKSHQRVMELKYQLNRYHLEYFMMAMKEQQQAAGINASGVTGTTPPPLVK
jgi:hypothetical protein